VGPTKEFDPTAVQQQPSAPEYWQPCATNEREEASVRTLSTSTVKNSPKLEQNYPQYNLWSTFFEANQQEDQHGIHSCTLPPNRIIFRESKERRRVLLHVVGLVQATENYVMTVQLTLIPTDEGIFYK
jgi:hypothetical protein